MNVLDRLVDRVMEFFYGPRRLLSSDLIPRQLHMPPIDAAPPVPARHQDPGGVFAPKPAVGRDANPRLEGSIGQNRIAVPKGGRLQLRHRTKGSPWSDWSGVAGDEVELRVVEAERG